MGVSGFTTFVDNNLQLLVKHRLHDTKLIIDGNNLYHILYYNHNVDVKHGGDYDKFERKSRHFFEILKQCNITPYVVFDGGYDVDDKKRTATHLRAEERISTACAIIHDHRGRKKIMPILAYETFRCILNDIGVAHCVCDFEADNQIAVLANELSCPVTSFDSDFYIFNMRGGFVPFDSVDYATVHSDTSEDGTDYKYLTALIYFAENFTKVFPKVKDKVLPFVATLLGNDFVEYTLFKSFYREVGVPKAGSSHFIIPKNNWRMLTLLKWLENVESMEYAIQKVLSTVPKSEREKLQNALMMSMNLYEDVHEYSGVNLKHVLEGMDDIHHRTEIEKTYTLPKWFRSSFWKGNIAQFCQNIITLRRVYLLCQVEKMATSSSYSSSAEIRRILYGILLTSAEKRQTVTEYDREKKSIKKREVEAKLQIEGFGKLPSLEEIPDLSEFDRITLILACLDLDESKLSGISKQHWLEIAVLVFWVTHADPKVTLNQIKALLVCFLTLSINNRFRESDDLPTESTISLATALKASSKNQLEKVTTTLGNLQKKMERGQSQTTDVSIIHSFAQFQTCLLATIHLNQVLLCPLISPNPARIFNGSFLYKFSRELDYRPNVDLYIAEIFQKHSPLLVLYNALLIVIQEETKGKFDCSFTDVKARKRKRTEKRKAECVDSEKSASDDEEDTVKLAVHTDCALSNRFMALGIEN